MAKTIFPYLIEFERTINETSNKYEASGCKPLEVRTKDCEIISYRELRDHPEIAACHQLSCECVEKKIDRGRFEERTRITILSLAALPLSIIWYDEDRYSYNNNSNNNWSRYEMFITHYTISETGNVMVTKEPYRCRL